MEIHVHAVCMEFIALIVVGWHSLHEFLGLNTQNCGLVNLFFFFFFFLPIFLACYAKCHSKKYPDLVGELQLNVSKRYLCRQHFARELRRMYFDR